MYPCVVLLLLLIIKIKILKNNEIFLMLKKRGNDYLVNITTMIFLFFQRLSIIDHENGNQPLIDNLQVYNMLFWRNL